MSENKSQVETAVKIVNDGGIVIFPTDTAFGIGCRIDDQKAVERLFRIRKRPKTQAAPVLVGSVEMAQNYLEPIPKDVLGKLVKYYWPGALTIILPCKIEKVTNLVRGERKTLGVRMPNHQKILKIIKEVGVPILGPSANFHGEKTPYKFSDLSPELIKLVDYVLKGQCSVCQESTVIDCTEKPWRVLRQGAIKISKIIHSISSRQEYQISKKGERNILLIDSSSNEVIKVGLRIDGKEDILKQKIGRQKAQVVLPMVEKILKKHKLKLKDLTAIEVNINYGSFTGLRVGVSIANALGFTLKIPINGKRKEIVMPVYE